MESISFDRAADYYDRTRSLSDEAMRVMVDLLRGELAGRERCLEIGVGTGRIAIPLAEAGVRVAGIDLSEPMLAVLRRKTGAVPVAAGDATRLPFPDDTFDGALACHVLHLIPDWWRAVGELVRVVGPSGRILVNLGGWHHGTWRAIEERFVAEAGIENPRVGATEADEVDAVATDLGATVRVLPDVRDNRKVSYGELIDRIEEGMYSFTWGTDEVTRRRAAQTVRQWVSDEHGSLDELRDQPWIVAWRAYDLPRE